MGIRNKSYREIDEETLSSAYTYLDNINTIISKLRGPSSPNPYLLNGYKIYEWLGKHNIELMELWNNSITWDDFLGKNHILFKIELLLEKTRKASLNKDKRLFLKEVNDLLLQIGG